MWVLMIRVITPCRIKTVQRGFRKTCRLNPYYLLWRRRKHILPKSKKNFISVDVLIENKYLYRHLHIDRWLKRNTYFFFVWVVPGTRAVLVQTEAFSVVVNERSQRNQYFAHTRYSFIDLTGFETETLNCS